MMILTVRESTLVAPAEQTPTKAVWISNLDLVTANRYTLVGYFYCRPAGGDSFVDPAAVLRDALSRALVPFYPIAGRLRHDKDGRLEIDCNGKGALFVVAESTAKFDDLGDFSPTSELRKLIPEVDYTADISSFPLLMLQITLFECGGVCIGAGTHHRGVDGFAALDFMRTWCNIARGLDVTIKPFLDRTVLRARDPPRPRFHHIEFDPPEPAAESTEPVISTTFNITLEQLNKLRHKFKEDGGCQDRFSTYEVVSAHAWRCRCIASGLAVDGADQETRLLIATNGRQRLQPPLPVAYFGNVVFIAIPKGKVSELASEPAWYAARKIREATQRMDDDYLRSSVDYLELLPADKSGVARRPEMYKSPNLGITSWIGLPTEETDFGWGPPVFVGPLSVPCEGIAYLIRCPDGNTLSLAITLQTKQMKVFREVFYKDL